MHFLPVILGIILCLAVGGAASLLQGGALTTWYPFLNKSALTPPGIVFGGVWTLLYILMGVSIGLVWSRKEPGYKALSGLFALQLAVSFVWSVAFFLYRSPWAGLAVITVLLPLLLLYMKRAFSHNRASAWLFVPYVLWVAFAWYLNFYVALHN